MHLASLMTGGKGKVISLDRSRKRLEKLLSNLQHHNVQNVYAFCADAARLLTSNTANPTTPTGSQPRRILLHPEEIGEVESFKISDLLSSHGFAPQSFDKIMLDPPCSGLGGYL